LGDASVKKQAFAQKGLILKDQGKDDEAQVSFENALLLGNCHVSNIAKKGNPYAALCAQVIPQIFQQFKRL
jgi:hypothetical protein